MSNMPKDIAQIAIRGKFGLSENTELGYIVDLTHENTHEIAAVSVGVDHLLPGIMIKTEEETFTFVFSDQRAVLALYTALAGISIQSNLRLIGMAKAMHDKVGCEDFHPIMQEVSEETHRAMAAILESQRMVMDRADKKSH